MVDLKYLVIITRRENCADYLDYLKKNGVKHAATTFGNGTATKTMLDYLDLERSEKALIHTVVSAEKAEAFINGLIVDLGIGAKANGVAMTIPLDSIGGISAAKWFTDAEPKVIKEEEKMAESEFTLIVTIADKGSSDIVMEAARGVGAQGGTVIRARGTGAKMAKIFGLSISEEKEMVYIVAARENRNPIMRAIMEKAGAKTPSHGIVFSLPVDSVAGVKG